MDIFSIFASIFANIFVTIMRAISFLKNIFQKDEDSPEFLKNHGHKWQRNWLPKKVEIKIGDNEKFHKYFFICKKCGGIAVSSVRKIDKNHTSDLKGILEDYFWEKSKKCNIFLANEEEKHFKKHNDDLIHCVNLNEYSVNVRYDLSVKPYHFLSFENDHKYNFVSKEKRKQLTKLSNDYTDGRKNLDNYYESIVKVCYERNK